MTNISAFRHEAFIKLFQLFKKKYYTFGSMRGTVSLKEFQAQEMEEIAGFLGIPSAHLMRKATVSLKQFEEKLETSAFAHFTLVELVEQVLREKLQTKEQAQQEKAVAQADFIEQLCRILVHCPKWLAQIEKRATDSRFIWQQQGDMLPEIERVVKAIAQRLPENELERLPVFAQRTSGNPHAFDAQTLGGKLLLHAAYSLNDEEIPYPKTTEEKVDLLATLQIVQDDLWNFVTWQGLYGYVANEVHPLWQAAVQTASAVNMPMRELMKIDYVQPTKGQSVWVVENSGVASTLMDAHPTAPIICTHGQLRLAGWRLLDLLPTDVSIYYSGDLDPEGLLIAQKIVARYGARVKLWQMNEASYHLGKSEALTAERLLKLQKVTIIPSVVEQMNRHQQASYQEAWLNLMMADIQAASDEE